MRLISGLLRVAFLAALLGLVSACNCSDLALAILTQPTDQSVVEGASATFTVKANAAVTGYQWQRDTGSGFADIAAATEGTLHTGATTLAMSGTRFRVIVSGLAKATLTSDVATLTVTSTAVAPTITGQPTDQHVVVGAMATFTVTATGTAPLTYQWQRRGEGTPTDIAEATSATYTTPAAALTDDGAQLQVVVRNSVGSATSNPARLTVTATTAAPVIVTPPADLAVDEGQPAMFGVTVAGTPTPSLQWRRASSEGGFVDVNGATGTTLSLATTSVSDTGARFQVVASNDAGVAISAAATLTVRGFSAPVITQQPSDLTVDSGSPASFTVVATGVPAPTYQWRHANETLTPFDGGTSATLTFPNPSFDDTGTLVQVVVSNSRGSVTSSVAALTVLPAPLVGFSEVSTGFDATLGLKNGTVYAWGDNNYSQLGRPGTSADIHPRPVAGLSGTFLHVLMRGETSYALRDDHTVWAWGSNSHGQLGNPAVAVNSKSATAVQVLRESDNQPLTGIVAVAANDADSGGAEATAFGVTATGALWVWGSAYVEPGTPSPTQPSHLRAVPNIYFDGSTPAQTVKQISVGSIFGYVLAGDDNVYTWVRTVPGVTTTVTRVNVTGPIIDLSVSWGTAYVVTSTHELWDVLNAPVKVPLTYAVDWIRTGQHGSLTIAHRADTGALYAWGGTGQAGQFGDGTAGTSRLPADAVPVLGITDATLLAVGQVSAIALRPGGALWGWGDNYWGLLGTTPNAFPTYRLSPYALTGL